MKVKRKSTKATGDTNMSGNISTNDSVGILTLAQKIHDELIADAKVKAELIIEEAVEKTADANAKSEQISADAEIEVLKIVEKAEEKAEQTVKHASELADSLLVSAEEEAKHTQSEADREALELLTNSRAQAELITSELNVVKSSLLLEIGRLQAFEADYRQALRELVIGAQITLDNTSLRDEYEEDYSIIQDQLPLEFEKISKKEPETVTETEEPVSEPEESVTSDEAEETITEEDAVAPVTDETLVTEQEPAEEPETVTETVIEDTEGETDKEEA